jgi:UDP-N-acetylglucosamine--dolichyl-phosphate N-acetylglucosaminephosphotransferase
MDYAPALIELLYACSAYLIVFAVGLLTTFVYTPKLIKKATDRGYVVKDMYKKGKPNVPNLGGLSILVGMMSSLIVAQFLVKNTVSHNLLVFYFMVLSYALFGLMDDLLDVGRKMKIYIPFFLALPILLLTDHNLPLWLRITDADMGLLYLILAPMYVMVVSNLVNMHSGFNGLSCGLSYIVLVFTVIKVAMGEHPENIMYILPVFGSILAFLYFETYPARIFWANIGSLMVGASVGGFIVLNHLELFGIVILIPHIINFLMYVVWKIKKVGEVKFGGLREDGTLIVPNPLTFKWLFPYYYRLTEHQTMWIMYAITMLFGMIALIIVP